MVVASTERSEMVDRVVYILVVWWEVRITDL